MIKKSGYKIKKIREFKSYVADKLNISTGAYSKIENDDTELNIKILNEIGDVLEIDSIEILGFDEKLIQLYENRIKRVGNIF